MRDLRRCYGNQLAQCGCQSKNLRVLPHPDIKHSLPVELSLSSDRTAYEMLALESDICPASTMVATSAGLPLAPGLP